MILGIKQVQNIYMNCFESMLATVATWFGRNYELMFSEMWDFDYLPESVINLTIGSRLYHKPWDTAKNLELYHGIKLNETHLKDNLDIIDFLKKELHENRPVFVGLDAAYWPWAFENERLTRTIEPMLVTGLDEKNKEIFCLDIHALKEIKPIPIIDFLTGCDKRLISFSIVSNQNIDYLHVISNSIDSLYTKKHYANSFDAFREFSNSILTSLNYTIELGDKADITESKLFQGINDLIISRDLYGLMIQHISLTSNMPKLLDVSDQFHNIAREWTAVRALLQKTFYTKNILDARVKISNKIKNITTVEEKIPLRIPDILRGATQIDVSNAAVSNDNEYNKSFVSIVFVDLKNHMNIKCIESDITGTSKSSFYGAEESCLSKNDFPKGILKYQKVKFLLPSANDNIDCLICNKQVIKLPKESFKYAFFLGFAIDGSFKNSITVKYMNEQAEEMQIQFDDIIASRTGAKNVAWEGRIKQRVGSDTLSTYYAALYAKSLKLKDDAIIDCIILPEQSNIHIMSITLCS